MPKIEFDARDSDMKALEQILADHPNLKTAQDAIRYCIHIAVAEEKARKAEEEANTEETIEDLARKRRLRGISPN